MSLTPFESMAKLTSLKEPHTEAEMREFNSFIINKGFSMSKELIFYAELANWNGMSNKQVHDLYFNGLPKRKYFSKWAKPSKKEDALDTISKVYKISKREAALYLDLLSETDIKALEEKLVYGGPTKSKKEST